MGAFEGKHRVVIVPASAGSGKTYRIAHEFMYDVLRNRYDNNGLPYFDRTVYRRILAVTFTNKATEEMKSRILSEIHKLASGDSSAHLKDLIKETGLAEEELRRRAAVVRQSILHDYSHFTVLTNDTFFQRILRAFLRELGIDINFSIELDNVPIFARSIDMLIERVQTNEELRNWIEGLVDDRLRDGEKWNIRYSIAMLRGDLFKESTRDIVRNMPDKDTLKQKVDHYVEIATQRVDKFQELAQKASKMIEDSSFDHSDFKSSFTKIFDCWAAGDVKPLAPSFVKFASGEPKDWIKPGNKVTAEQLELAEQLQSILVKLNDERSEVGVFYNTRTLLLKNYRYIALLQDLQECVNDICGEENSLLLSETKHTISDFISEEDAPFIYEKVGSWYEKFMIDEFQDTSAKEWRNFLPLLRNAMSNSDDTSVLIVGDVKQSIYRWRGGDWRILGTEIEKDLKEGYRDPLKHNWRSLPNIVKFNNFAFASIVEGNEKSMDSELQNALAQGRITDECYEELNGALSRAYAKHEQEPALNSKNQGYISFTSYTSKEANDGLAYINDIRRILDAGFNPCDITILVRKNDQAALVAKQLLTARSTFPDTQQFEITTEEALRLTSSQAVQFIIATMRLAINRRDKTSLAIYNKIRGVEQLKEKPNVEESAFLDTIRMMSPEDAFEHILMHYDALLSGDAAYVHALHENIVRFSANRVADIALFERWWRDKGESISLRVERSKNAIEVMTIHKAKGLENKIIIIPQCSWSTSLTVDGGYTSNRVWIKALEDDNLPDFGYMSIGMNKSVADSLFADGYFRESVYAYIDSVNMLYVALTRAKEQLYIYSPKGRSRHIGDTLAAAIGAKAEKSTPDILRFEMGVFEGPEPEKEGEKENKNRVESIHIAECEVSPVNTKFRTSSSRYFADEKGALSPRSIGIRLHRIFEESATREDLLSKLDEMVLNGDISAVESDNLREKIYSAFENPLVEEWFSGDWERVYNERTILGATYDVKRPDRVMVGGDRAVVVDYKFGDEQKSHKVQISGYMQRLRAMGYGDVKGYVWYVPTGQIVEVEE